MSLSSFLSEESKAGVVPPVVLRVVRQVAGLSLLTLLPECMESSVVSASALHVSPILTSSRCRETSKFPAAKSPKPV